MSNVIAAPHLYYTQQESWNAGYTFWDEPIRAVSKAEIVPEKKEKQDTPQVSINQTHRHPKTPSKKVQPAKSRWIGTSSHTWQTWIVRIFNQEQINPLINVKIAFWPLSNWCYLYTKGSITCHQIYNKNPFNHLEKSHEYQDRMKKQIQAIENLILGTHKPNQNDRISIIALVAIDFIIYGMRTEAAIETYQSFTPKPHNLIYLTLYRLFQKMLTRHDWHLLATCARKPHERSCAILFDKKRYSTEKNCCTLNNTFSYQSEYYGGKVVLIDNITKQLFSVAVADFPTHVDPRSLIHVYQIKYMERNIPTILTGSFHKLCSTILIEKDLTTLANYTQTESGKFSIIDPLNKPIHGGICFSPGRNTYAKVCTTEKTWFCVENGSVSIQYRDQHIQHFTNTGRPWKKETFEKLV